MAGRITASDSISVYHAALSWFGKDLHEMFKGYGLHGGGAYLYQGTRGARIACAVLSQIESEGEQALRESWLSGIPASWMETLGQLAGTVTRVGQR